MPCPYLRFRANRTVRPAAQRTSAASTAAVGIVSDASPVRGNAVGELGGGPGGGPCIAGFGSPGARRTAGILWRYATTLYTSSSVRLPKARLPDGMIGDRRRPSGRTPSRSARTTDSLLHAPM